MQKFAPAALLLAGLLLPIILFWQFRSRSRLNGWVAAAIAIATGWALNVGWAFASEASASDQSQASDTLSLAMRFGFFCPTVLVFFTWLVWRFKTRRKAADLAR